MFKKITILSLVLACSSTVFGQKDAVDATKDVKEVVKKDVKEGWQRGGSFGMSFSSLSLINPRFGSGQNQNTTGGALQYSATLKRKKLLWDNNFTYQLGLARIGSNPWTKAAEMLQITSQAGFKLKDKIYIGGLADVQSQALPTYGANYLSEQPSGVVTKLALSSRLFSPATFRATPGIIYKPNANLNVLMSPVAMKGIYVRDTSLANTGRYFPNPKKDKTLDFQMGANARIGYTKKFFGDKLSYKGALDLYTNYLRNPQNIDVEFYNTLDLMIIKNFAVSYTTNWFYDDDVLTYPDGYEQPGKKRIFFNNLLLLTYKKQF